jgi:putative tryptophan/tyrosine transport system substrate-binding protein
MKRREFISLLGSGLILRSLACEPAARAAQTKVFRIGNLTPGPVAPRLHLYATFREGLRQLGYIEGRDYVIELRSAEGQLEKLPDLAAELVAINVDVIIAATSSAVLAAKRATERIPIVMISVDDPVAFGFVKSLARPGGNITGLTTRHSEVVGKRLQLLKDLVPGVSRVALLHFPPNSKNEIENQLREAEIASRTLEVQVSSFEVRVVEDLESEIRNAKSWADAMMLLPDVQSFSNRAKITELAAKYNLPAIYGDREFAEVGGLIAYGPSIYHEWNRAAAYVDQIIKGAKPADMAVEGPSKFDLIVNTKTAEALGLTIPPQLQVQAETTEREGERPQRPW